MIRDGNAPPRAPSSYRLSPFAEGWKRAELRLRSTYLHHTPPALLARIDPPLRRVLMLARRVAAAPLYLRHPLARYTGSCDGAPARLDVWSPRRAPGGLPAELLDDPPEAVPGETRNLAQIARLGSDADLLIAHTTPLLAPLLRRAGFHVVPALVRVGGRPAALLAELAGPSLRGDRWRLARTDYRVEHWSHTPERSRLFYDRYLLPHSAIRFRERAEVPTFDVLDRFVRAGILVAVGVPGAEEPDAIGLVIPRGRTLWCMLLGTRDAERAILRRGGMAALYRAQIQLALDRGVELVDFGRCLPWASDGVLQYKWKWGMRPIPDGTQTLEYAIRIQRPESAVARRLVTRGVIVREGASYRVLTTGDLSAR